MRQTLIILSLIIITTLGACSIKDDFGRSHKPHTLELAKDVVGSIQERTGILSQTVAFHIPLSHEEHTLRQTLSHFRRPFLYNPTLRKPLGSQTIAKHKSSEGFRDFFLHQVKSDRRWLNRFNSALSSVIQHDRQRYEVVASTLEASENDGRYIKVRIRENRGITMRVMQLLDRRMSDYDKALDYGRLAYPEKQLVVMSPVMDKYRAEVGLLKAKYETYVYQRSSKANFREYE